MRATIDLGVLDSKGMFITKYSSWDTKTFSSKKEAQIFGKGIVCGLEYKWQYAACQMRFEDGSTELFF
jgi:hypothetical protein